MLQGGLLYTSSVFSSWDRNATQTPLGAMTNGSVQPQPGELGLGSHVISSLAPLFLTTTLISQDASQS